MYLAYNIVATEEANKPAVALCNEDYVNFSVLAASHEGMPGIRIVSHTVPVDCVNIEQIEPYIDTVIDDIVAALTKPLTAEEKSPKPKEVEKPSRIIFKGNLQEVNQFFYQKGWADGLPIIPPTEEAVAEMLTGTDLPSDHVVAKLSPRFGKATVEKIAINAVMAGALPTYMPLLIAAVDALTELSMAVMSAHSFAPFWIINGPVRHDLNMNTGAESLSPGHMPNAAIGRAMGLIVSNIAGARKGIEDKGTFGNPAKHSMVLAENEEGSPWEPLHVESGFKREDSTITLFYPNIGVILLPYGLDDKGILNAAIYNIIPGRMGSNLCFMMPPIHAKTLADNGWTKKQIESFISQYACVPAYRHPLYWGVYAGRPQKERIPNNPMDPTRIIWTPEQIKVVVAGGASIHLGLFMGAGLENGFGVTKKVEFQASWDKLVAKYKNILPQHVMY